MDINIVNSRNVNNQIVVNPNPSGVYVFFKVKNHKSKHTTLAYKYIVITSLNG